MNFNRVILGFCVFIMPLTNLMWVIFPIDLLGKNFWLLICVLGLFYVYLTSVFGNKLQKSMVCERNFAALFFLGLLICTLRFMIYDEIQIVTFLRMGMAFFLYILVFSRFVVNERNYKFIVVIFLVTIFFQAGLGISHSLLFPEISVPVGASRDELAFIYLNDDPKTREGGSLGSSIYANVIVCGMFVLIKLLDAEKRRMTIGLIALSSVFLCYATYLSGSRYPIVISLCLLLFLAKILISKKSIKPLVFVLLIATAVSTGFSEYLQYGFMSRFEDNGGGRLSKAILSISLIFGDFLSFIIGPPSAVYANAISEDGYAISDNSYLEYGLFFGILYSTFFYYELLGFFVCFRPFLSALFGLYIVIGLSLTNCIFWDQWMVIAAITLSILNFKQSIDFDNSAQSPLLFAKN